MIWKVYRHWGWNAMRTFRFFHSLRFKITAGITIPLLVILSAFANIHYVRHRQIMLDNLEHSTTSMGQVITASLEHALGTHDVKQLQPIVDRVGLQGDIVNLALLNKQGEIRVAPQGQRVGTRLDQQDPSCQVCHRYTPQQRKGSVILDNGAGERVFRAMVPIENRPECYGCHDAQSRLIGMLLVDLSMATMDQHLQADLWGNVLWSVALILVTVVIVNLMMGALVVIRLEKFLQAIQRFGRGDLVPRLKISERDEIGELAQVFNQTAEALQAKEQENRQLYAELQRKEIARGRLLEKLITAQEEERKRIARELHDQLGQALSAMTLRMDAAENALSSQPDRSKERLADAKSLARRAFEQTYQMMLDLRPITLDDLGLVAAIRSYAQEQLEARGVALEFAVQGTGRRIAPQLEITLFRIAQEAINNIALHAQARHVHVAFEFSGSHVQVAIEDDGCGFDLATVSESEDKGRGLGLLGMRERAEFAEGVCLIDSHPERGTRVLVTIPLGA